MAEMMRAKVQENGAYCVTVGTVRHILQYLRQVDRPTIYFLGNEHTLVMVETLELRFIFLQDNSGLSVVVARSSRAGRCLTDKLNGV
jgi:hypothetical protein